MAKARKAAKAKKTKRAKPPKTETGPSRVSPPKASRRVPLAAPVAAAPPPGMLDLAVTAGLLGVLVAVLFSLFEWLVKDGTNYIWNDLFNSDEVRWLVLPLAIGLGLLYAWLLKLTRQPRLVPVRTDFTDSGAMPKTVSLADLAIIFLVGAASLLAGASLGPEASLVALCSGLGFWLAGLAGVGQARQLVMLSGVGALLVAFTGSLLPVIIPLLLLRQKKKLSVGTATPVLMASLTTYFALFVIHGQVRGWGGIPASTHFGGEQYLLALALGGLTALAAMLLKRFISRFAPLAGRIYQRLHWAGSAAVFGAVIGLLYLAGGQSVQFNGAAGSELLLSHQAEYDTLALAGLLLVKLAATAWSLAAGYRGGIVFPSIYAGVAISLLVGSLASGLGGVGTMVGAIAGIFAALTSPALGFIMLASFLPLKLIGLAVAGILGAVIGEKVLSAGARRRASPAG